MTHRQVGESTIRRYLKLYRQGGFEALKPKTRSDILTSRTIPEEVLQMATALKEEAPQRSVRKLISILEKEGLTGPGQIKQSTLSRLLSQRGYSTPQLKGKKKLLGRFQADHPNQIWQSDCLYGPYLPDPNNPEKTKRTYLFAFIDDFSRLVPHGEFYWEEKLPRLENTLKKALLKRGIPEIIYVDNHQVYSAHQMSAICAELAIRKISCRPYSPEGKGKIEKFQGFVTSDFLIEVRLTPIKTLQELNEAFWAWLEVEYHQKIHSETGEEPLHRWTNNIKNLRHTSPQQLARIFLWRAQRKASKTNLISLEGNQYELDPHLAGRWVEVRYNPFDLSEVHIYYHGQFHQKATPFTISRWTHKKVEGLEQKPHRTTGIDYLKTLKQKHHQMKRDSVEKLGFCKPSGQPPQGTFQMAHFIRNLAKSLGRKQEELEPKELELIKLTWEQYGPFTEQAVAIALGKAITAKGTDQHISFYLEAVKEQNRKFKEDQS